jgi:N-acetyl-anhydromuramyl-L-alanine amidase AmpD
LHEPIVVLHETVGSFESVMSLFGQSHPADEVQVSYHALIRENGAIVYVVPPEYRAYGAGDSVFINADRQEETVQTNGKNPPSVNNFAYHISLVTPADGRNNRATHGGYTKNQYEALAWLVAKTGIADDRITTHKIVDRSGTRTDPRSFNPEYFLQRLHSYPKTQEIIIGCTLPDAPAPPNLAQ